MKVDFGFGKFQTVSEELERLNIKRALVLSTPPQEDLAREAEKLLGDGCAGVFAEAEMHVPIESARKARKLAEDLGVDGYVAAGGGSTIGLGKAIALESEKPIIAIPTTYAGSEMTPVWGITDDGVKTTGKDPRVLPVSVIYDPELTLSLPTDMSVVSGYNAIAHAAEALYAPDKSPIISLMAEEGARALLKSLPSIVADGTNRAARSEAFYGSWLCGATLGATTMSLHHKLCHTLGGTFNLSHAETHTVVLPYVLAYNLVDAPDALEALRRATGSEDPAAFIQKSSVDAGAPAKLASLGFRNDDVELAVEMATKNPYKNPRPVTKDAISRIVKDALNGEDVYVGKY